MPAPPAHHLSTARLPLYGDQADGTPLDVVSVGEETGVARSPDCQALGAELSGAGGAEDGCLLQVVRTDVADCLTVRGWTPGPAHVERHLPLQSKLSVSVEEVWPQQALHLGLRYLRLVGAGGVGAGDGRAPLRGLQTHVPGQTLRRRRV